MNETFYFYIAISLKKERKREEQQKRANKIYFLKARHFFSTKN